MAANEKTWADWTGEAISPLVDEGSRVGLALLWRAYVCADATGANLWDFALRTGRLYEAGMTSGELRWMVAQGFAEPGQETSGFDGTRRSFLPADGHFFNEQTCLILT